MFELKRIAPEAVPLALEKAERYRLLGEPEEAESICLDILAIDPENQPALITLLLALTDQFPAGHAECFAEAQAVLPRLKGDYERLYYSGILWERRGRARLLQGGPGSNTVASPWLHTAMDYYAKAEAIRPAGNDDALLRWNTCARLCTRYHLAPQAEPAEYEPALED
jgi:hypothetical protein